MKPGATGFREFVRSLVRWAGDRLRAYRRVTVVYSEDGAYYYARVGRPAFWLGTATRPCVEPDDVPLRYRVGSMFGEGAIWYSAEHGAPARWRPLLPFVFWKVRSGRSERIPADSLLVLDYEDSANLTRRRRGGGDLNCWS